MSRSTHLLPLVLLAPFAVAEAPLLFAPAESSSVERTATWTERTETVDVSLTIDGEATEQVPTVSTASERTLSVESKETFVRTADGRLLELVRAFGPITMEASADIELELAGGTAELTVEGEGGCELEDIGVRFAWDPDREEWIKTFAEDYQGREELLDGLAATTELLVALPEKDTVEVDDRWDLDVDALFALLRPGGALPLEIETDLRAMDGVLDPILLPGALQSLVGDRAGEIEARVASIDDERVVLEIRVDVLVACDHLESGLLRIDDALPEGSSADLTRASYETEIEGKGELVWDRATDRMAAFRLDADLEVSLEVDVDVSADGVEMLAELRETREGRLEIRIESAEAR